MRCCECGTYFPDPAVKAEAGASYYVEADGMSYYLDIAHIPPGPYWPSIAYLNR